MRGFPHDFEENHAPDGQIERTEALVCGEESGMQLDRANVEKPLIRKRQALFQTVGNPKNDGC